MVSRSAWPCLSYQPDVGPTIHPVIRGRPRSGQPETFTNDPDRHGAHPQAAQARQGCLQRGHGALRADQSAQQPRGSCDPTASTGSGASRRVRAQRDDHPRLR